MGLARRGSEGTSTSWTAIPRGAADGRLNVVIEVPAGTLAKWEVTPRAASSSGR